MTRRRVEELDHPQARDTEEVFRALIVCKGKFDARVILAETKASLDALHAAGRIRPKKGSKFPNAAVEIMRPALHVQLSKARGQWDVRDGRRIESNHATRAEAMARAAMLHAQFEHARRAPT